MPKKFIKIISIITCISFILTGISHPQPVSSASKKNIKESLPNSAGNEIKLPGKFVKIKEIFMPAENSEKRSDKKVFFIQDVHSSVEAQKNIARAIGCLVAEKGINNVAYEGNEGVINTDELFGSIGTDLRKEISEKMLDKFLITGAEYARINTDHFFNLVGIEDEEIYYRNVDAFKKALNVKQDAVNGLKEMERKIAEILDAVASSSAKRLVRVQKSYGKGILKPLEYAARLNKMLPESEKRHIKIAAYLEDLKKMKLADSEKTRGFSENGIDAESFAKGLEELTLIAERFTYNGEEKELVGALKNLNILSDIISLSATRRQFEYYLRNRRKFRINYFESVIEKYSGQRLVGFNLRDKMLKNGISFYSLAVKRDAVMADKILELLKDQEKIALIAGGFHTDGLKQILKKEGISYVLLTPRFSGISGNENEAYFDGIKNFRTGNSLVAKSILVPALRRPNLFNLPVDEARKMVQMELVNAQSLGEDPWRKMLEKSSVFPPKDQFRGEEPVNFDNAFVMERNIVDNVSDLIKGAAKYFPGATGSLRFFIDHEIYEIACVEYDGANEAIKVNRSAFLRKPSVMLAAWIEMAVSRYLINLPEIPGEFISPDTRCAAFFAKMYAIIQAMSYLSEKLWADEKNWIMEELKKGERYQTMAFLKEYGCRALEKWEGENFKRLALNVMEDIARMDELEEGEAEKMREMVSLARDMSEEIFSAIMEQINIYLKVRMVAERSEILHRRDRKHESLKQEMGKVSEDIIAELLIYLAVHKKMDFLVSITDALYPSYAEKIQVVGFLILGLQQGRIFTKLRMNELLERLFTIGNKTEPRGDDAFLYIIDDYLETNRDMEINGIEKRTLRELSDKFSRRMDARGSSLGNKIHTSRAAGLPVINEKTVRAYRAERDKRLLTPSIFQENKEKALEELARKKREDNKKKGRVDSKLRKARKKFKRVKEECLEMMPAIKKRSVLMGTKKGPSIYVSEEERHIRTITSQFLDAVKDYIDSLKASMNEYHRMGKSDEAVGFAEERLELIEENKDLFQKAAYIMLAAIEQDENNPNSLTRIDPGLKYQQALIKENCDYAEALAKAQNALCIISFLVGDNCCSQLHEIAEVSSESEWEKEQSEGKLEEIYSKAEHYLRRSIELCDVLISKNKGLRNLIVNECGVYSAYAIKSASMYFLARLKVVKENMDEALRLHREGIRILEKRLKADSRDLEGRTRKDAEADEITQKKFGVFPYFRFLGYHHSGIAKIQQLLGNEDEAKRNYKRAEKIYKESLDYVDEAALFRQSPAEPYISVLRMRKERGELDVSYCRELVSKARSADDTNPEVWSWDAEISKLEYNPDTEIIALQTVSFLRGSLEDRIALALALLRQGLTEDALIELDQVKIIHEDLNVFDLLFVEGEDFPIEMHRFGEILGEFLQYFLDASSEDNGTDRVVDEFVQSYFGAFDGAKESYDENARQTAVNVLRNLSENKAYRGRVLSILKQIEEVPPQHVMLERLVESVGILEKAVSEYLEALEARQKAKSESKKKKKKKRKRKRRKKTASILPKIKPEKVASSLKRALADAACMNKIITENGVIVSENVLQKVNEFTSKTEGILGRVPGPNGKMQDETAKIFIGFEKLRDQISGIHARVESKINDVRRREFIERKEKEIIGKMRSKFPYLPPGDKREGVAGIVKKLMGRNGGDVNEAQIKKELWNVQVERYYVRYGSWLTEKEIKGIIVHAAKEGLDIVDMEKNLLQAQQDKNVLYQAILNAFPRVSKEKARKLVVKDVWPNLEIDRAVIIRRIACKKSGYFDDDDVEWAYFTECAKVYLENVKSEMVDLLPLYNDESRRIRSNYLIDRLSLDLYRLLSEDRFGLRYQVREGKGSTRLVQVEADEELFREIFLTFFVKLYFEENPKVSSISLGSGFSGKNVFDVSADAYAEYRPLNREGTIFFAEIDGKKSIFIGKKVTSRYIAEKSEKIDEKLRLFGADPEDNISLYVERRKYEDYREYFSRSEKLRKILGKFCNFNKYVTEKRGSDAKSLGSKLNRNCTIAVQLKNDYPKRLILRKIAFLSTSRQNKSLDIVLLVGDRNAKNSVRNILKKLHANLQNIRLRVNKLIYDEDIRSAERFFVGLTAKTLNKMSRERTESPNVLFIADYEALMKVKSKKISKLAQDKAVIAGSAQTYDLNGTVDEEMERIYGIIFSIGMDLLLNGSTGGISKARGAVGKKRNINFAELSYLRCAVRVMISQRSTEVVLKQAA